MNLVLERGKQATQADRGVIALYSAQGGILHLLAQDGYPPDLERYRTEPWSDDKGITGRVARTGQTALVPDVRQDPDYIDAVSTSRSQTQRAHHPPGGRHWHHHPGERPAGGLYPGARAFCRTAGRPRGHWHPQRPAVSASDRGARSAPGHSEFDTRCRDHARPARPGNSAQPPGGRDAGAGRGAVVALDKPA